MRLKLYPLFVVLGLVFGCSTAHEASGGGDFDQSTPDGAAKLLMHFVEQDNFGSVKKLFADSAKDDFDLLERRKRQVSSDIRGAPLNEIDFDVKIDGNSAVVTLPKEVASRFYTDSMNMALQSGKWVVEEANFKL